MRSIQTVRKWKRKFSLISVALFFDLLMFSVNYQIKLPGANLFAAGKFKCHYWQCCQFRMIDCICEKLEFVNAHTGRFQFDMCQIKNADFMTINGTSIELCFKVISTLIPIYLMISISINVAISMPPKTVIVFHLVLG